LQRRLRTEWGQIGANVAIALIIICNLKNWCVYYL
jgi:hypothetical protein